MTMHNILIIEDEPVWQDLLFDIISESIPASINTANSFLLANDILLQRTYSLIVLDVSLDEPNLTLACQHFCASIRRKYTKLPIIGITGKPLAPDETWMLHHLGITEFFYKHRVDIANFRACVQKLVNPNRSISALFMPEVSNNRDEDIISRITQLTSNIDSTSIAIFAGLLQAMLSGSTTNQIVQEELQNSPSMILLLQQLTGQQIASKSAQINFGDENQLGELTIRDISNGNIINITVNIGAK